MMSDQSAAAEAYIEAIDTTREQIHRLIVEMLRYQRWELPERVF